MVAVVPLMLCVV